MWADVVDLNEFYQSRLGQVARRMIRRRIRAIWPDLRGLTVVGLGYATPYLRAVRDEAARAVAVMPAQQGVLRWPTDQASLVTLADETELPFADVSVDRLLMVHAVECSERLRDMMREAWRVLSGSGRLLVIVPNRTGIWARVESTPFGLGHPYSQGQIRRLLRDCLFTPMQTRRALFVPPTRRRMILHSAPALENLGARWAPAVAGVLMIEAAKQIYAPGVLDARTTRRRPALISLPGGPAASVNRRLP